MTWRNLRKCSRVMGVFSGISCLLMCLDKFVICRRFLGVVSPPSLCDFLNYFPFFSLSISHFIWLRAHTHAIIFHTEGNLFATLTLIYGFGGIFSPLAGFSPLCRAPCVFLWNLNLGYIVSNDDVDDEQRIPQRSITQLFIRWHLKCHQMSLDTWDCLHARRESIFPCLLEGKAPAKIEVSCC